MSGLPHGRMADGPVTLVGPDAAVLLGAGHDAAVASALGRAVRTGGPAGPSIAELALGCGDAAFSGYVRVDPDGVRALARGGAWASITATDGQSHRLEGTGPTLRELVVDAPSEVELGCPGPGGDVRITFFLGPEPVAAAAEHLGTQAFRDPEPSFEVPAVPAARVAPAPAPVPSWDPPPRLDGPPTGEFDFAHLVEGTQHRGVEAAAVRETAAVEPEDDFGSVAVPEPAWEASPPAPTPAPSSGFADPPPSAPGTWTPPPLVGGPSLPAAPSAPVAPVSEPPPAWSSPAPDAPAPTASGAPDEPASGPQVQAVSCPLGHLSHPAAAACRVCGSAIVDRSVVWAPRPVLSVLRFDSGKSVELDRSLLIGRRPSATDRTSDFGLVAVDDPESSVSRSHVELTVEDWQIAVTDLGSTNGTVVEAPGEDPIRLRAHEPHVIAPGVRVVLGGSVTFDLAPPVG